MILATLSSGVNLPLYFGDFFGLPDLVRTPDLIYVGFPVFGSAPVGVPNDCLNVFAFCAGVALLILSKSDLDIGSGATPVISPVTSPIKLLAVIIPLVLTEELFSNVVAVSAFPVTSPVIFPITFPVKGPTN